MKKSNSTWRALLLSIMSLTLCATMLVGSTHAWYTDKNASQNNKVVSGSMSLALYQIEADAGGALKETDITDASQPVFNEDKCLEPGGELIVSFKLKNTGTLALRWKTYLQRSTSNNEISKKIDVYAFTNTEAIDPSKSSSFYAEKLGTKKGTLYDLYHGYEFLDGVIKNSGDEMYFAIVLKLHSDLDMKYQGSSAGVFDINIIAAQASSEKDIYDAMYDDVIYVTSRKDFVEADFGGKIVMPSDVDYENNGSGRDTWMLLESKDEIDFDGGGNTLTLSGGKTPPDFNHNYFGFKTPVQTDITVSNLRVTGTGFVTVGDHDVKPSGNYTVNNLVIEDMCTTHTVKDGIYVAHAFGAYGTTTLNNCIMKGTTVMDATANAYDIGCPNNSSTTINGGEYGKLYGWSWSNVTIYGAKVGTIDSRAWQGAGTMVIGAGTTVDIINVYPVNKKTSHLVIEPGASVGIINYNGTTYTMDEWINNPPGKFVKS